MIIAIDGPAGSGKSTIAREVASRFGFFKLDTGAMYRSVALTALERGISLDDERATGQLAHDIHITFGAENHGNVSVFVDGRDVSEAIRSPQVDRSVSAAAANPIVRAEMLDPQRRFAEGRDVVAEGRDIGTVVFPNADLKIFLTADPRERARRRVLQRHEAHEIDPSLIEEEVEQTLADIERRDALDSERETAPLTCADDAFRIDSTSHTIDEIVSMIERLIAERR